MAGERSRDEHSMRHAAPFALGRIGPPSAGTLSHQDPRRPGTGLDAPESARHRAGCRDRDLWHLWGMAVDA
jgi:hypothetical protein